MDPSQQEPIDLTEDKDGGVIKRVLRKGDVDVRPANGNTVYVHYVGKLDDGTVFDSSKENGKEFEFKLNRKTVIEGFDLAAKSMSIGELASIRIEPKYGYGDKGSPPKIPPGVPLTFEMELLSIEGEDVSPSRDKTIFKSVQVAGEGYESPRDDSHAKITVICILDKKIAFQQDLDVVVGECTEANLPEGMDKALMRMRKGEKAYVQMRPRWNYGESGCAKYNIPPNALPEFIVTLHEYENSRELWGLSNDELLAECKKIKDRADTFLKSAKYQLALNKYQKIDGHTSSTAAQNETPDPAWNDLKKSVKLNMALAHLKMNECHLVIEDCNDVLAIESKNVKALYRRAQALQALKEYEDAIADYGNVLSIEPENKAAMVFQAECQKLALKEKQREKNLYSAMFAAAATSN